MSENEILRRASYGPTSPVVGTRGSRTRARVVETALALFETQGFHGTSVDDIATAAGVSRATLYQYFESKEQIFVELLQECGTALMRVVRRIGPLEPTELGFDNLHWWLGEWAWVYDKYATMFVQWANISSPGTSIPDMASRFLADYHERIARRLASSGVSGIDPADAAVMLTTLVNACNYARHAGPAARSGRSGGHAGAGGPAGTTPGSAAGAAGMGGSSPRAGAAGVIGAEQLTDSLAVIVQLLLFPQTPPTVFAQLGRDIPAPRPPSTGERLWSAPPAAPLRPAVLPPPPEDRFAALSSRASATVGRLLDAGVECFTEKGYHQCSVDDVVSIAGYARGTFYKYFDEKLDLLVALSDQALRTISELDDRMCRAGSATTPDPLALRSWLTDVVTFALRYLGVTRIWLDQQPQHPRLEAARAAVGERLRTGYGGLVGAGRLPHPLDSQVASIAFFALVEQLPEALVGMDRGRPVAGIVDLVATALERTRLRPPATPAAGPAGQAPS
ncbi:TetR family transcriptional regulator [Parafrankia colletiae]|uniref:TetR family transcriptional regulator n=1 Tax=Parafrankia colletiae TaxID=573497 RepID=A0A1S1QXQ1_9ACTN|nr:TetR/AcrR family transcriptional regulator [Parafrankia colletiae]MCK9898686.1 TetR/AcrR family transcriptional regulator [Frankia sp. Cpl3]OHV39468.1 TetR family transcriptional regulator [Parafrankia colletiae]